MIVSRLAYAQRPRPMLRPLAFYPHLAAGLVADPVLPHARLGRELVGVLRLAIADAGEFYAGAILGRGVDGEGVAVLRSVRLRVVVEGLPGGMRGIGRRQHVKVPWRRGIAHQRRCLGMLRA